MTQPFSVRIFLADGDPAGIKVVEKSNWTGVGLVFPQPLFNKAKERPELQRTGVYVLVGPGESAQRPRVYIGEGDPIGPRLSQHELKKDWWTHAVCFTSKDQNLNKAHIQYLESRLVALAGAAKRCDLDNGNTPQPPSLSEADRADAEGFLQDVLLCMPILGYTFFEQASQAKAVSQRYELNARGVQAEGFESSEGFVVVRGSHAAPDVVPSLPTYFVEQRAAFLANGLLKQEGQLLVFTEDYVFPSPSSAASAIAGRNMNGREAWRTMDGRTLKEVQGTD